MLSKEHSIKIEQQEPTLQFPYKPLLYPQHQKRQQISRYLRLGLKVYSYRQYCFKEQLQKKKISNSA